MCGNVAIKKKFSDLREGFCTWGEVARIWTPVLSICIVDLVKADNALEEIWKYVQICSILLCCSDLARWVGGLKVQILFKLCAKILPLIWWNTKLVDSTSLLFNLHWNAFILSFLETGTLLLLFTRRHNEFLLDVSRITKVFWKKWWKEDMKMKFWILIQEKGWYLKWERPKSKLFGENIGDKRNLRIIEEKWSKIKRKVEDTRWVQGKDQKRKE